MYKNIDFYFFIFSGERDEYATRWTDIGYYISVLKKNGINVHTQLYDEKNFQKSIIEYGNIMYNDWCGIFCEQNNIGLIYDFLDKIENRNHKILLFGLEASFYANKLMKKYDKIDFIIIGEVEKTLVELIEHVIYGRKLDNCNGICYRENDGSIRITEERALIENLDELPFPDRDFLPKDFTRYNIMGSRGCTGHCTFCCSNILYTFNSKKKARFRTIDNILDEVEWLKKNTECQYIYFEDSTFDDAGKRYDEMYEKMKSRSIFFPFFINVRSELITNESIRRIIRLKEVGLDSIFVGFDSGNDEDLKLYGKLANLSDNVKAIEILNKNNIINGSSGIIFNYGFINFNPYTSLENLKKNCLFFKENKLPAKLSALSNRMRIDGWTPLTKKIEKDKLMKKCLEYPFEDKFCYNFQNKNVEKVYNTYLYFKNKVNTQYYMDIMSLCNQYQRMYGGLPKEYQDVKEQLILFRNVVSEYAIDALLFIIENIECEELYLNIDEIIQKKGEYIHKMDLYFRIKKMKIAKELYSRKNIIV